MSPSASAKGLRLRRVVLGGEYVDRALRNRTPLNREFDRLATEFVWGTIWTRPGLTRRERSMILIGMLAASNRGTELETHLRGALRNGCREKHIREVFLMVMAYCGAPAALEGFRIAGRVLDESAATEMRAQRGRKRGSVE